jgi:glutathione S-transferase
VLARFGIADAAIGAQLAGLQLCRVEIDAARWPRTAAYRRGLEARPSFKTAMV